MTTISKGSANKFQLVFPVLPELDEITAHKKFSLNIIDGVLPSYSLTSLDVPYKGGNVKMEGGFGSFGDWETNVSIDSNFETWIIMSDWMFSIANNREIHGRADLSYQTDANLHILDNFENKILDIKFENIWPVTIGEVQFSYQDAESVLTFPITFNYDRFYRIVKK